MRTKHVLAVACVAALAVAGCGSKGAGGGGDGSEDTLTLGASLSLTGSLAREGQLTKQGYELCEKTVNAKGGVPAGDRKLKLNIRYQDDKSEPETAAQIVDGFNDDGISFILGPYSSSLTEAAAAVIERNGQVMVDSAGADDKIFTHGYQRTFAVLSPATEYAASMVKAIDDLAGPKPKSFAFLSADDGFSKTAAEGGVAQAKELGYDVVAVEYFPENASDVSASLTKARAKQPDVIIGSVHLTEGLALVKQANELGVEPAGIGETVAPPTPDFVEALGEQAEGVLGSSQWTQKVAGEDQYFGTAPEYAKSFEAEFGQAPEYHNAEASAACLALVEAVEDAGSAEPDAVRDALADLDNESFFGPLKFNDRGMNVYKEMAVIQIQDGKAVTVWPENSAEAELVWPGN
ncbi:MAG: amino acid ABC transporter substrate-binding protein [Streptomycetales bacterium]